MYGQTVLYCFEYEFYSIHSNSCSDSCEIVIKKSAQKTLLFVVGNCFDQTDMPYYFTG